MIKEKISKLIRDSIKQLQKDKVFESFNIDKIQIEHPEKEVHGDYSTNVAMMIGKKTKKNPMKIAELLAENFKAQALNLFEKVEVIKPGFINFRIKQTILIELIKNIAKQGEKYGRCDGGRGKTLIIDYSAPNIAKPFSIGHLRSTIIGQSLYNLYKFTGWKVVGDNHLGDWGTQFGKLIVAIRKWADKPVDKLSIDELEYLYVKFHKEAEQNPELDDEARQAFKSLEDGKKEERIIWKQLVKGSMKEFQYIYNLLGVNIDVAIGESFYEDIMPEVIKEAKKKGVARKSKGALIISYPGNKLPPAMLLKSDGATTYFTRDLATIKFRKKKWNPDLMIYEVGVEQSLHFQQLFWAVELLGWAKRNQFIHVPHGLIRLKEGKISTRKGRTIKLEGLVHKAIEKASQWNNDPKIAKAVGIGAVKYNDLKHSPTSGYVFSWDEALNLKGNSGPYLQYTYARCRSVLEKGKKKLAKNIPTYKPNAEEFKVLRWIYRFPEIIHESAQKYAPNILCNFLFELAQRYNTFYSKHSILSADSDKEKQFRIVLTKAVSQVIKNGLKLLGISIPEKM
jgi:arginyl-tRNA synthetase